VTVLQLFTIATNVVNEIFHKTDCKVVSFDSVALSLTSTSKQINYIMALTFTDANFEELVLKSDKPVLVDFWAEWCGPCRVVGPIVEELATDFDGTAVIGKVDVDSNPNISMQYGIRNIPTLLVFKNGQVVDKQVGAVPKAVLAGKLTAQMA
jgi:thioredoxin 1